MILQALADYYHRKATDPDPARRLAPPGTEEKEIPYILELARDGRLVGITTTYSGAGRKKVAQRYRVPQGVKKTSGIAANLLWDNAEYVLALPDAKKLADARAKGKSSDYQARLAEMQAAFVARIEAMPAAARADDGVRAVLAFLPARPAEQVAAHGAGIEIAATNPILSFRLADDVGDLVCQRPAVAAAAVAIAEGAQDEPATAESVCLVTGDKVVPERLHTAIKGVWGAQTSGANIVSFNLAPFNSYGKEQGANAPVGADAAFAYTTALNHLLAKGSRQRVQVGDASTVFWAQKAEDEEVEAWFADIVNDSDDPDAHIEQVRAAYESIHKGQVDGDRGQNRFYVLGLSPNAARLSVRFWHAATVEDIARRIRQWYDDLRVVRGTYDRERPSLKRLLASVCLNGELDRLPPTLSGDIMRAILEGGPFPVLWLNTAVLRCRAEQRVTYLRACVLKACLARLPASIASNPADKEITEMLDPQNASPGYRLGRLFAVLERAQEESSGGALNTTIRERYYGAASSTPAAVFTTLLRLKNHHVAKLARGRAVNLERVIGEIADGLGDFPSHLALQEQARFALGYYHQRQIGRAHV